MEHNKEHLQALLDFIDKLCAEPENEWFRQEISKRGMDVSESYCRERVDAVYEYCIEQKLQEQARDFYARLPKPIYDRIGNQLEMDFVRMQKFWMKNEFGDFTLALYQQIEAITNVFVTSAGFQNIVKRLWKVPAFVKRDWDPQAGMYVKRDFSTRETDSKYSTIAQLIFGRKIDSESGKSWAEINSGKEWKQLSANHKIRIMVYYIVFQAYLSFDEKKDYYDFTQALYDIYLCRNKNHREGEMTERQEKRQEEIFAHTAFYVNRFLGALAQLVDSITSGYGNFKHIAQYAKSMEEQTNS